MPADQDLIPDGVGREPLVGWRAWDIEIQEDGTPRLTSPTMHTVWQPGWTRADPCSACVASPSGDCRCGINAISERRRLGRYLMSPVVGQAQLTGEVRQFQHGYRGSAARPIELHVARGQDALAAELAGVYGCPVLADRIRPRLALAALGALVIAVSVLAIVASMLIVHSAARALIAGQEIHQMRTLLIMGAAAFIGSFVCQVRFDLGTPRLPVACAALGVALAPVAAVCVLSTIPFQTHTSFRTKLAAAARSNTHDIRIDERSAMALLPASHISPGSCTPIRAGDHMLRVCRTAGRLHVTRLD